MGGAAQTQGAGLLLNLRTRMAEAWVYRVRGMEEKASGPRTRAEKPGCPHPCKDSPAAGNLHNILCKLISD